MKTTDYSRIADNYDKNSLRHEIPRDQNIELIYAGKSERLVIVDLACGTGNYLKRQIAEYSDYDIDWIGIDKSEEMLRKAKAKNLNARLVVADACQIPIEDRSIDYVKVRFAFHHFTDKVGAIDEMARILKPGGIVSLYNLAHDYMRNPWVYKYFPMTEEIDIARFPKSEEIYTWFERQGFAVEINVETTIKNFLLRDILSETINRDMSQLNLISDVEYRNGLERMKNDLKNYEYILGDISFIDMLARKQ